MDQHVDQSGNDIHFHCEATPNARRNLAWSTGGTRRAQRVKQETMVI